ncbi:MAG: type IV pilus modification protein PilV [Pseudomonadales bacterium]|nr:type IV pilus modification protein PilV [Pseudomonadales bacterium]
MNYIRTMHSSPPVTPLVAQRALGFTLIEVMVTVFVLAVGILGVAGMQAVSVRESGNTYHRTQADLLVVDIVDRMRANRNEARKGANSAYLADPTQAAGDCEGIECDEPTMAGHDLREWNQSLMATNLPNVSTSVTFVQDTVAGTTTVGSVFSIQIFWDEDRDGSTGKGCDPDNQADMSCTSLTIQI